MQTPGWTSAQHGVRGHVNGVVAVAHYASGKALILKYLAVRALLYIWA